MLNDSDMKKPQNNVGLVTNLEYDRSDGTAIVTIRTNDGDSVRYRVRTEANVKAIMGNSSGKNCSRC